MLVKELLPQKVVTAESSTKLSDLARKMRDHRAGIVPILESKQLVGVVTDRDIAIRAVATTPDCSGLCAEDVMTREPVTVTEDTDIEDVAVLMRTHRLHRLVVIDDRKYVSGVISLTDLSLLGEDAFEVLRRLSEQPAFDSVPAATGHGYVVS